MPKYLISVSYSAEGVRGVIKEGGSSRKALIEKVIAGMGGSVEAFYYSFGDYDVHVIADAPGNVDVAAVALAVAASGAGSIKTTVLLTPEEVDEATKKSVGYRPPGA
jgi:uncharacterized protein with GYD domain